MKPKSKVLLTKQGGTVYKCTGFQGKQNRNIDNKKKTKYMMKLEMQ